MITYLLQGKYAGYWETLYEVDSKEEAYRDLEDYDLNEKDFRHRVIVKRQDDILENGGKRCSKN